MERKQKSAEFYQLN